MPLAERLNALTHGVGALLALVGAIVLVGAVWRDGSAWTLLSVSVYGVMLVALYTASTLYHAARGRAKAILQKLDHGAIYLLIAGTYTPFLLGPLRGPLGWTLFTLVWGLALVGIARECARVGRGRIVSVVLYVAMGWLALVAVVPLARALPAAALAWLIGGGVCYTAGIVFYGMGRRWPLAHPVWHLFVLGGSGCHFAAVARSVL